MGFAVLLPVSIVSIISFVLFVFTGIRSYKNRFKVDYDIRNTFPYEINYHTKYLDNVLPNVLLTFSILLSIFVYVTFDFKNLVGINVFILIAGVILSILVFVLYFIDLKYLRSHMAIMVLTAVFSFALGGANAIGNFVRFQNTENIYYLILCVICGVFALVSFVLIMNPKLSLNLQMETVTDEKGNKKLVRPKYFVIAFTEWILAFTLFINQILLVLAVI